MNPEQIAAALQAGDITPEAALQATIQWLSSNTGGQDVQAQDIEAQAREFVENNTPRSGGGKLFFPVLDKGGDGSGALSPDDVLLAELIERYGEEEGRRAFDILKGSEGHDGGRADAALLDRLAAAGEIDPSDATITTTEQQNDGRTTIEDLLSDEQINVFTKLIQSGTRGGRGDIFQQHLASSPDFGNTTSAGRNALTAGFNPFSAAFALQTAQNPDFISQTQTDINQDVTGEDFDAGGLFGPEQQQFTFTEFLRNNPQTFGQQGLLDSLNSLAPTFSTNNPTDNDKGIREFLSGPTSRNLISQLYLSGINPVLRPFAQNTIGTALDRFRGEDASTPFLQRLLQGGAANIGNFFG